VTTGIGRACAFAALLALPLVSAHADTPVPNQGEARVLNEDRIDGKRLERELQGLDWEQFRAVIEAIPKLKADVDAYGPAGWEFVKGRYKTHAWKKNIDRLDDAEKQKLAALIDDAERRR
jgi:hypothetical protein